MRNFLYVISGSKQSLSVAQIARRMGLSRQNVLRIANELEKKSFLQFTENPDHKRARLLALAPMASSAMAELEQAEIQWVNRLAEGLEAEQLAQTLQLLSRLRQRCEEGENPTRSS